MLIRFDSLIKIKTVILEAYTYPSMIIAYKKLGLLS
jgi:hypothetical protein